MQNVLLQTQNTDSLAAHFERYFEVVPADTSDLLEEVFRIRFQVLCQEQHIPNFGPSRFPNGLETDEYDARSVHCLLRHRPTGATAGAVRLVLSDPEDPHRPFPIEQYAGRYFDRRVVDPARLPRRHTAEISRLVLARRFRARRGEDIQAFGINEDLSNVDPRGRRRSTRDGDLRGRRRFPHPLLGLFVGVSRMAAENDITHFYTVMEPVLNRLLRYFDLHITPIGEMVELYGLRQPYLGIAENLLGTIYHRHRAVWELITDGGRLWPVPG